MPDALVSVVIPNWNGKHFLTTCLDSLQTQSYSPIEIIIVDNASTDGSQTFIREQYPEVRLIELDTNRGFTGACNAGIEVAQGELVALLNNDTEVDTNWVRALVDAFATDPKVGIVASKMLLFDKRDHIHTVGDYFTTGGQAGNRGVWQRDTGQYNTPEYVFSACGGASAYRQSLLEQTGLLDDDFFFLLEDMDLAWRAQLLGWQALYTPNAIVYHHLSATGGGVTASFYNGRNTIILLAKNFPWALWRKYAARIMWRQLQLFWQAIRAWRGKEARAYMRGVFAGIWQLPSAWRKRRTIQASRVVSIEYLDSILSTD